MSEHRDRGLPPLPQPFAIPEDLYAESYGTNERVLEPAAELLPETELKPLRLHMLRNGCYLIHYQPLESSFNSYWGTMRVERNGTDTIASGDLYKHFNFYLRRPTWPGSTWQLVPNPGPKPDSGIPIFARNMYTYYLRVTRILEWITFSNNFTLGFELYRYDHTVHTWSMEKDCKAVMTWNTAPIGYPDTKQYLTGQLEDSAGLKLGSLTMGWIDSHFRKVVIEIDRVSASETPVDNGAGVGWTQIFDAVNWDLTMDYSHTNLTEPSGDSWSNAEMHAKMLSHRDVNNLDKEWRYYLICVRNLDATSRGIMFDAYSSDSNNVPREGAGISSHWVIPDTSTWGLVKGMRFGAAGSPYFRTAVHELGHAMGLYHNSSDNGFMNVTPSIAAAGTTAQPFPTNVLWSYNNNDLHKLRHLPDMWVRPGGKAFGSSYTSSPISSDEAIEAEGFRMDLKPLQNCLPLGAPVRVQMRLTNFSDMTRPAPTSLSLKHGFVTGKVIDSRGVVRTFVPMVHCVDDIELGILEPHQSLAHAVTLLRGAQGALFPDPGNYRIIIEARWEVDGVPFAISGETPVMVMAPVNVSHANAALAVLSEPDTLPALVLGGDHLDKGHSAIKQALANPILKPHFAFIEARRLMVPFADRLIDLTAAARFLDGETIMTTAELKRAAIMIDDVKENADIDSLIRIVTMLEERAHDMHVDDDVRLILKKIKLDLKHMEPAHV